MDSVDAVVCKRKKMGKQNNQNENETSRKRKRIDSSVEEENDVASRDRNSVENNSMNVGCGGSRDELSGKSLRSLLSSPRGLHALKKFITICNETTSRDLVAEYLHAGGSVLEILKLLSFCDKKNTADITTVFSAINILLIKILAEYPQYQNNATEACRHLLNSHMSIIHSMLSVESNAKQRKVTLRLLAVTVSLDISLSRDLLANLSLQRQALECLVRPSKSVDPESVRTCFVHFILAFLMEGNVSIIRMLLAKRELLSSIFPELIYDSKDTISLVLTTLKTYLLENTGVSKTMKLHIFSIPVVLNLISLYNWKGPNNWHKNKSHSTVEDGDFVTDKMVVNDIVHEFLLILLTSHRYGIIFHDRTLGTSRNKNNQLVYTVLQNLEKPWEHEKPSDLIVKIMRVCPDLIRSQYGAVESFLEPRISPKWICLLTFLEKIIKSIDPVTYIETCSSELTADNLINVLLSWTAPNMIIKGVIVPGLNHDSLLIRHQVLNLLLAIVDQLKIISLTAKAFYKTTMDQCHMVDFVLRTVPSLEMILRVWRQAFEIDTNVVTSSVENISNPELVDHLDIILSVLYSYQDTCPELLDSLADLQPRDLLSSLNNLQYSDGKSEGEIRAGKINRIKIKTIRLLLALDSSIFAPREEIFKEALLFLISQFRQETSSECYNTTRMLLNTSGLFEACDDQLDIWINAFDVVDSEKNGELVQWFMSILKNAVKHTDKYINNIMQVEGIANERNANFDVKKAKDIINELFDRANESCNSQSKKFCTVESPLINGSINLCVKKDDVINDSIRNLDKENSRNVIQDTNEHVIWMNEQVSNLDTKKKIENIIDELFDKINRNSFSFHNSNYARDKSSASFLINGQLIQHDIKRIDNAIIDSFDKFHEKNHGKMQSCTSVSPLLYCALRKADEKKCSAAISAYLSYVTVHTLHYQVMPELLIHIAANSTNLPMYKYLQGWTSDGEPVSLKSKLPSLKLLQKMSNLLLTDTEMDITELAGLFGSGKTCSFRYGNAEVTIEHRLSSYDVKALSKMTTFYLVQLAQRRILRRTQNKNCKTILVSLLNIARSMDQESTIILEESAKCVFTHPILLHYFSPFCGEAFKDSVEGMITDTVLEICRIVAHLLGKSEKAYDVFAAFGDKFLTQLRNIIENNPTILSSDNHDIAIALIKVLPLRACDVVSLLLALMELEKTALVSNNKQNLSVLGYIVLILLDTFCEQVSRSFCDQRNILGDRFVTKLCSHLIYLKSVKVNCVNKWEEALVRYLSIFPHDTVGISTNTFALLLTKGIVSTSTIQVVTTLINKNTRLIPSLVRYLQKAGNLQGDVAFAVLNSNLRYNWNEKFLLSLYEHHGGDIAAYLTEPRNPVSWIEENIAAVVHLIENTFELALCETTHNTISQSGDKLEMVSISYVELLESLYKRYETLTMIKEKPLTDLIMILVHVMTLTLKKESRNIEKFKILCDKLDNAVTRLKAIKYDFIFSSLSKSYSWPQFTRFSLKLGLKDAKDDETQSSVLKTLGDLCNIVYEDNVDDENARTLFEMATSHSEFVNVMLGSSKCKDNLVELLRILIRKNHSVMIASHIPLYLAAYNASLSHVDQRILQILQYYEAHNINSHQCRPYLWGSAAAVRYSIKGEVDTALWRQPSTFEIFNLFDKDIVNNTIKNYPIHRALKNDQLYDESNYVYDPAFYLPLLCSLLTENNVVACHKMNQSGALALTLAACCSDSSDIQLAAYTIISRYYFHLEASRSKNKLLWMRLIDALRNGVLTLKCPLKDARLSCLATTFLARVSLVASQPLHPLFSPLHTFLMAKPALDLDTIPELLQLLHSSHMEHKVHRHWILENIRDGIREEADVDIALKCMLYKILLDFHTCILSDIKTKKLILEIIASTTRISKACLLLIEGYGVLSWLHETVKHLDTCETETETIIINIIENLLNCLNSSIRNIAHYKFLFSIMLQLKAHFSGNAANDLYRYTNVVKRVTM